MQKKSVLFLILCLISEFIFSQSQTPVYLSQAISNANSKGFYQYLPAGYSSNTKNYPLIIWVHGAGQVGQGNVADLPKILEWGVPKIISEGGFPTSFTVGDSSFSFIIISPQFIGWPSGANVGAMISYAMSNYRVDPNRVYLMGISAGGGGVWEFASASTTNSNKLAAIIPFCGTLSPTQTFANKIAASNLPVWAFHNTNDGTVPIAYSRNWKNYINGYVPNPNPLAKLTEFPVVSNDAVIAHECWSLATLPTYKPSGINIYEWLLSYRKRTVTINLPPLASAGQDQGVVLPANAVLDGSASTDPDGIIVTYKWRKISGPVSYLFSDSTLIKPTVSNLVQGVYKFELSVTDNLAALTKDTVVVNVYANLPAGAQQRILIDVGPSNANGGTITGSPAINGNVWNNMNDGRPGIRVANALTINNQLSGISVEVINRVDGTYGPSGTGMGTGNTAGIVGDYPASATTDHALIHVSTTNGKWKIKGLLINKIYAVKFWGTRSNTTAARNAEIKRADDNVWKTYSATANTNYNNAAVFNITGKTEMEFDIRTKAGSDFSALNVIDISFGDDTVSNPPPPPVNLPPVAKAGADTTIQLPIDSVSLRGCSSSDPEQASLKYKWKKISGPATYQLPIDTLCTVNAKALVAGIYEFELTVTDTAGLTGKDSVVITVNSVVATNWPPQVTPLCSKPYKIVVVGSSTAYGTGANPIDSSWVRKFKAYLLIQNSQIQIINIATLGLSSWDVSPTGTIVPAPFTIDTLRNITKALSYNPDAIILNLPSNDVARGIVTSDIHTNFLRITALADAANVPIWVTTTQPRDRLSPAERILQMDLRDWIKAVYGNKSVDFWSTISNSDGTINTFYGAGDQVHLNNYGHHVLFTRIVEEKIWDTLCKRNNLTPLAIAGNDITIAGIPVNIALNGTGSYDPDGTNLSFNWRIISNASGVLNGSNSSSPVFTTNVPGTYLIELKVIDNMGSIGLDTLQVKVYAPNLPPIANAGADILLLQTQDSIQLNGNTSFDTDGSIVKYKWEQISGSAVVIVNDSISNPLVKEFTAGTYLFLLTVMDDSLAVDTDTIRLIVNAIPIANAGVDQSVTLPTGTTSLNGAASNDIDGTIVKYRWKKIAGDGTVNINDSTTAQTALNFVSAGQYIFELVVTDNMGAIAKDTIMIIVNPDPNIPPLANAGADQSITLPNNTSNLNGDASLDADGNITAYKWKKISGNDGVIITNTSAIETIVNFVSEGQYLFELEVTDNNGAIGKDTVSIIVNPVPNIPPVANAGNDQSITLPNYTSTLSGSASLDADGAITAYKWKKISGNAGVIITNTSAMETVVNFVSEGQYLFELEVTDNKGASGKDTVMIIVNPDPNILPIANAGADQAITLPNSSTLLNGSTSFDNDGSIATFRWKKISGAGSILSDSTAGITSVSFVSAGQYLFELVVTDNLGAVGKDTVKITVNPDPNTAPIANAGSDKSITLPVNKVFLDGRSSYDPEGTPLSFNWQFVSGPAGSQVLTASKDTCSISFVNAGTYIFKLTVTDAGSLSGADNVTAIVLPVPDITKRIKVNIYGGTNPYINTQWNNWNIAAGLTSSKFSYEDAVVSNINASLSGSALVADNGANYSSSATVCPSAVLRYNSANTSMRTLTFSGFNTARQYSLEFYASRANTGNSTAFIIGTKSDTISTSNNINDYAKFINISPDNTGKIIVNIRTIGTWNYLAGFMITEQDVAATLISLGSSERASSTIADETTNQVREQSEIAPINIQPNPAKEFIKFKMPDTIIGKYSITLFDITGKTVWKETGIKNKDAYYHVINIAALKRGLYILQLNHKKFIISQTFIKQ